MFLLLLSFVIQKRRRKNTIADDIIEFYVKNRRYLKLFGVNKIPFTEGLQAENDMEQHSLICAHK